MANDVRVSIKDKDMATSWLMSVVAINEDYHAAMKEAGETLTDMQNFADGTVVDDFVNVGNNLLVAAQETFNAVSSISDTVNTILGRVGDFVSNTLGVISKAAQIFGV